MAFGGQVHNWSFGDEGSAVLPSIVSGVIDAGNRALIIWQWDGF
jgi:hypothetical protein